jgi:hypothetical protein
MIAQANWCQEPPAWTWGAEEAVAAGIAHPVRLQLDPEWEGGHGHLAALAAALEGRHSSDPQDPPPVLAGPVLAREPRVWWLPFRDAVTLLAWRPGDLLEKEVRLWPLPAGLFYSIRVRDDLLSIGYRDAQGLHIGADCHVAYAYY